MRLGANQQFAGRGVKIAFSDSGFYPRPDLTRPENRVLHYVNTARGDCFQHEFNISDSASSHGTMTSVVAAGDGYLSGGCDRGIASEANVMPVKVRGDQGIHNG